MKALTLTQPWATLMSIGAKRVETRSWRPRAGLAGQAFAIHAGAGLGGFKRDPSEHVGHAELQRRYLAFLDRDDIGTILRFGLGYRSDTTAEDLAAQLPRGVIVGEGVFLHSTTTEDARVRLQHSRPGELALGNYSPGRWAWTFDELARFTPPITARGGLGLWDVPEAIADELAERALRDGRDHL